MPRCLFCLQENSELTDEHVFPAALGGNLLVKNSVCADCNNGFSKAFEQQFAKELAPLRHLLLIPDRYGDVPEVAVKAEVDGKEYEAKLLHDGNVQLKPIVTIIEQEDGSKEIVYRNVTDRLREQIRHEAKEKGFRLIESTTADGDQAEISVSGELKVIGSLEGLRTAAKIAYTGLAFYAGCPFVQAGSFAEVRSYIRSGDGEPNARLFVNERFLAACQQGPHQHSLVIAGQHAKHSVDAIVRIFGGLCYFVNLSNHYEGADFYDTLVFDAQSGERNNVLVVNEQAEFLQIDDVATSKDTIWSDMGFSGTWFLNFLDREIQSKMKR